MSSAIPSAALLYQAVEERRWSSGDLEAAQGVLSDPTQAHGFFLMPFELATLLNSFLQHASGYSHSSVARPALGDSADPETNLFDFQVSLLDDLKFDDYEPEGPTRIESSSDAAAQSRLLDSGGYLAFVRSLSTHLDVLAGGGGGDGGMGMPGGGGTSGGGHEKLLTQLAFSAVLAPTQAAADQIVADRSVDTSAFASYLALEFEHDFDYQWTPGEAGSRHYTLAVTIGYSATFHWLDSWSETTDDGVVLSVSSNLAGTISGQHSFQYTGVAQPLPEMETSTNWELDASGWA